ncbi:hypothetical protein KAR91_54000 [Candidatus Pacearchaeota archaeon]|nr:hypothetical protein [Candidatus Pacearchaeota archaeon]
MKDIRNLLSPIGWRMLWYFSKNNIIFAGFSSRLPGSHVSVKSAVLLALKSRGFIRGRICENECTILGCGWWDRCDKTKLKYAEFQITPLGIDSLKQANLQNKDNIKSFLSCSNVKLELHCIFHQCPHCNCYPSYETDELILNKENKVQCIYCDNIFTFEATYT